MVRHNWIFFAFQALEAFHSSFHKPQFPPSAVFIESAMLKECIAILLISI